MSVLPSVAPLDASRFESIAPKTPLSRLDAWDAARLFATLGIVWTHVCDAHGLDAPIATLGRFGTSYYILAAALFTVRSQQRAAPRKFSDDAIQKARRLLVPFVVWSAIYFVYYYVDSLAVGNTLESLVRWWGPLAGTALHLWFLPFIFVWGLWGTWIVPKLMNVRFVVLALVGPLACGFVYWLCYYKIFFWVDRYWLWTWHLHRLDRWIDEAPLYVAAIVLGTTFQRLSVPVKQKLHHHRISIAWASVAIFFATQVFYAQNVHLIKERTGTDGRFLANVIGLALLCGSASLSDTRVIKWLAPWGRYTYVTFLVHVLVLEFSSSWMKYLPNYGTTITAAICTIIVFLASLGVSILISRSAALKWLRP